MSETDYNKNESHRDRCMPGSERNSHIWTGVFILLIGVAALIRSVYPDVLPRWVFSWQMLLIALGLFIGLRHNFKGAAWFILIIVGGVFLFNGFYPELHFRRYLWPAALIAVGLFFIFRPRRHSWHWHEKKEKDGYVVEGTFVAGAEKSYSGDDYVNITDIFGGSNKNILSKNFGGGEIVNIFGGTDLNLSQADIKENAVLNFTTIFGGTKLIVPSNWYIKTEVVTIFGGIEDKRQVSPSSEAPEKTLVLKGTVLFGGIDIKSYK